MIKSHYIIFIIYVVCVSCNQKKNKQSSYKKQTNQTLRIKDGLSISKQPNEDFTTFLGDFSIDKNIQKTRISDDATALIVSQKGDSMSKKINKSTWKFIKLIHNNTFYNVYNNFARTIANTTERVFSIQNISSDDVVFYYFKNIDTKWYLIKKVDSLRNPRNKENEDFGVFLKKFSNDTTIQKTRIIPEAVDCTIANEGDSTCEKIDISKWICVKLIRGNLLNYIYDNFSVKMEDTNERVFAIENVEGPGSFYYFKRLNLKWYFVKRVSYED